MVLEELRKQTRKTHDQLERNVMLNRLLGTITFEQYKGILERFYGFYKTYESEALRFLQKHPEYQPLFYSQVQTLENDLLELGSDPGTLPCFKDFKTNSSNDFWVGIFYTLEGSYHGRTYLWPKIQKQLKLSSGHHFFSEASSVCKKRWSQFCELLPQKTKDVTQVIEGSKWAFLAVDKWFTPSSEECNDG